MTTGSSRGQDSGTESILPAAGRESETRPRTHAKLPPLPAGLVRIVCKTCEGKGFEARFSALREVLGMPSTRLYQCRSCNGRGHDTARVWKPEDWR